MKTPAILILATLVALIISTSAQAQSVDFSFSGPGKGDYGVVGTSSDFFNAISFKGTTGAALAPDGTTTTGITFTDTSAFNYNSGQSNQTPPSDPLFNPYLGENNGSTITETLSGVAAGTYTLYLYGENGGFDSRGATFTLGGVSQTADNNGTSTPVLNANYVVYTNVTPTNGTIVFTYTAPATGAIQNGEGDFNGLQLVAGTAAPEPSTYALFALSLVGLGLLARRRLSA